MLNLYAGTRVGGRELIRQLRGSDGRHVFSAIELTDNRETVVKLVSLKSPSDAERLEREFAVLRDAAGPGVVPALEHTVSLSQGVAWLVLPAQGPSLASILASAEGQRLAPNVALAAIHAAAASLGELHSRGWRHGDVKPGNLLCNADGGVLLSDLEFALRLNDELSARESELRRSGTPPFMAPELWQADLPAPSAATDVWALGVTLYLCLFGTYPFGYTIESGIAAAIEIGLPQTITQLSTPVRAILTTLLSKVPEERPSDGHEVVRLIATTAKYFGIDLAAASRELGRLADGPPVREAPAEAGTMLGPFSPQTCETPPVVEIASVLCPPPPPGGVPAPPVPSRAGSNATDGVGAARSAESLLDRLQEFLDITSQAAPVPAALREAAAPAPKPQAPLPPAALDPPTVRTTTAVAPAQRLVRRAAARWYRRMNPEQNFPLSIVFSGKQIRLVGGSGLGVALGQQEIVLDPDNPVLNVEPWFPGCLVSPPRADVHVTGENTVCRFWITPLARGDLNEACVTIRYRGKVVETLATPAQVVTRTTAKLLAALGIVAPIAGKALGYFGWEPEIVLQQFLPRAAALVEHLGPIGCGMCAAGILMTAALVHVYVTRPLISDEPEPHLLAQPT